MNPYQAPQAELTHKSLKTKLVILAMLVMLFTICFLSWWVYSLNNTLELIFTDNHRLLNTAVQPVKVVNLDSTSPLPIE